MAFSGSSYFAGIGTACTVIAFGIACGTMVTTSSVPPPKRLERLNGGAADPSRSVPIGAASSSTTSPHPEQSSAEKPSTLDGSPSAVAAAPSAPAADPKQAPPPQPAAPATESTDAAKVQDKSPTASAATNSAPPPATKSEDAAPAKGERAVARSADSGQPTPRKRAETRKSSDDRKFSEHRRRHDQDERQSDEAANAVRQMPRDRGYDRYDRIVEQDDTPRYRMRPRPFDLFEGDGPPRVIDEPPPRFGFFGD